MATYSTASFSRAGPSLRPPCDLKPCQRTRLPPFTQRGRRTFIFTYLTHNESDTILVPRLSFLDGCRRDCYRLVNVLSVKVHVQLVDGVGVLLFERCQPQRLLWVHMIVDL